MAPPTPGYYCRLFLAPKKGGDWRPVLDLSPLNQFITAPKFCMDTAQSIMAAMRIGHGSTLLDLKDAFLHVPSQASIADTYASWLAASITSSGLTTSPYVFTRESESRRHVRPGQ